MPPGQLQEGQYWELEKFHLGARIVPRSSVLSGRPRRATDTISEEKHLTRATFRQLLLITRLKRPSFSQTGPPWPRRKKLEDDLSVGWTRTCAGATPANAEARSIHHHGVSADASTGAAGFPSFPNSLSRCAS